MIIQAVLPICLWLFALKHANCVLIRIQHSTADAAPSYHFTKERPAIKYIRVFGCAAYVLRLSRALEFEPSAVEGICLETLEHDFSCIQIKGDDGVYCLVESPHVTSEQKKFQGAPGLQASLYEEVSDEDTILYSAGDDAYTFDKALFDDALIISKKDSNQDGGDGEDSKYVIKDTFFESKAAISDEDRYWSNKSDTSDSCNESDDNHGDESHRYPRRKGIPPKAMLHCFNRSTGYPNNNN